MAIGKDPQASTSTGRLIEPIDVQLKLGRTGLGHDAEEREQQHVRVEAHMKRMQMQAKMSVSPFYPLSLALIAFLGCFGN
jgi:hypothetical protein